MNFTTNIVPKLQSIKNVKLMIFCLKKSVRFRTVSVRKRTLLIDSIPRTIHYMEQELCVSTMSFIRML